MYPYATIDEALTDVLRLSKGMTYKNAIAGLPLGGGKCVIVADPSRADKPDLLRAISRHVQALGGRYWTAIDVGVGPADADILAENCDFVFARASQYPDGFDPSLFTALGGFVGVQLWPLISGTGPISRVCAWRSRGWARRAAIWRASSTKLAPNSWSQT